MHRDVSDSRAALTAVLTAGALLSTGCPWGATGTGGASGDRGLDDSAEALVGTYRVESVSAASENCRQLEETEPGESTTVRIERMAGDESTAETRLRIAICRDGGPCTGEGPDAGLDEERAGGTAWMRGRQAGEGDSGASVHLAGLTKATDDRGWRAASSGATSVDGAASARRCRFEWASVQLVPDKDGVRIERTRRSQVVTLEGEMACRAETAEEFGRQLRCLDRTIWRAASRDEQ